MSRFVWFVLDSVFYYWRIVEVLLFVEVVANHKMSLCKEGTLYLCCKSNRRCMVDETSVHMGVVGRNP